MTQHTLGPWIAHGYSVYFKDPKEWPGYPPVVGRASTAYGQIQRNQAEANARLIAAAPDLLAALKAIVAARDNYHGGDLKRAIDAARPLIAKAEEGS